MMSCPPFSIRRCRAFTTTELLVVVAIVVILAAILFPVWNSAAGTARGVKTLNKMREIFTASVAFANDNRGFLPYTCWPTAGGAGYPDPQRPGSSVDLYWYNQVHPYFYTSEAEMFLSNGVPAFDGRFRAEGFRAHRDYGFQKTAGTWRTLDFMPVYRWQANSTQLWTYPNLRSPYLSRIPFLFVAFNAGDAGIDTETRFKRYCYHPTFNVNAPTRAELPEGTAWVYANKLPVVYCDGHARMIPFDANQDMFKLVFNRD